MWPERLRGVDHQRQAQAAAHLGELAGRLDDAAVAGQRGQVHQPRRIGGQDRGGVVDDQPAGPVDRQHAARRSRCAAITARFGPVLAGQAGHGARPGPAAQQQVEGVVGDRW